jgi:hypothetical protein
MRDGLRDGVHDGSRDAVRDGHDRHNASLYRSIAGHSGHVLHTAGKHGSDT